MNLSIMNVTTYLETAPIQNPNPSVAACAGQSCWSMDHIKIMIRLLRDSNFTKKRNGLAYSDQKYLNLARLYLQEHWAPRLTTNIPPHAYTQPKKGCRVLLFPNIIFLNLNLVFADLSWIQTPSFSKNIQFSFINKSRTITAPKKENLNKKKNKWG